MIKVKLLFLLLFLHFCSILSIFADDVKFFRTINTEVENCCITQDKDGLLWISLWGEGLFSYNGEGLKEVNLGIKCSFPAIWSMFVDSEGLIWFLVSDHALCSYDKKTGICKEYKPEAGNINSITSSNFIWQSQTIAEDKGGLIWVGTTGGLNSYDKKTNKFTQYKHNPDNLNSLSNNKVCAVFVDKEGFIWVGTEDGLNCYNKNSNSFGCYKHDPNNPNSIINNHILAIIEDKEGTLWLGTKGTGIDKFDKRTGIFTNYKHDPNNPNGLSHNQIHHLMVDRHNNLWISNDGNVGFDIYNIKTNTFKHYSYDPKKPNSISSNVRLYFFEDKSGIIWLIDSSGGVNKCTWEKKFFKNYVHDPKNNSGISSNILAKLYEDRKGNIWVGTYRGGMCLYTKDDKFEVFDNTPSPFSLPGSSVHSILETSDNKLWLGVKQGFICLFDTSTRQVIKSFKNPYLELTPAYLTYDNKKPDILWFACAYAGGVFKFNSTTGEFTTYKHDPNDKNSVSNELTFGILQDNDVLWIATGGDGLCKFDKTTGKCLHYKHDPNDKNSISGNIVIESFIDSRGTFWVTTDDGGLNKFDKQTGKFTSYDIECGFPSNCTRHILEDNEGFLWVSTNSGIVKFNPKKLKVTRCFTAADGLPCNQFDRSAYPLKDSKGNFWFSGFGLCKFNPEEANKIESHIPPIVLSSFKSKEGNYNEDGLKELTEIKLPWPDNSFGFTFAALDYMDPGKNQYAYKLEGFDKDWNYLGTKNFGQYSNLNPGEYILRLKGANNDGIWNEEGISIKITITPPFWMTSWFKGLVGIIILSITLSVFQLRIRALKKKAIYTRDHAIAEATAHVAHDIRSPLAALSTALKDLKELPEQKRILIRNATRRISDIANNILIKYKVKENENTKDNIGQKHIKAELVSSLLDHLMSEKRVQMTGKTIEIILELGNNTHSCFVSLEPGKFKRIISNLINNASEAIETKGVIRVVLTKQGNDLIIKIIDNGKGIPLDILPKIKQGGKSIGKKGGFGIGISSAIQNIKSWSGNYDIQSKVGEGTTFIITLPIAEEPGWFQGTITLSPNTHIIVLDDDESIHDIWQTHLSKYIENKLVTLNHFYEPLAFAEYCNTSRSENDLFLIDYELINSKETGLDLIEQLDLKRQAILVTSRYEEVEIRERIKTLGVKVIPKSFAPYIPITMMKDFVQPDLIFIGDSDLVTGAWKMLASSINKKMATFNSSEDFKKVIDCYDKNIPIYIDSDLKEEIPGEIFAKILYEQEFHNLYLSTGHKKDKFGDMPWIKEIVSKEAPF